LDDLTIYGVEPSAYNQTGGGVYRLCTTCGSRDGMLGAYASVVSGFLGLLMAKAERQRRLSVVTGEPPRTGPTEVSDLGVLLILLGGAAVVAGQQTYVFGFIPLWGVAIIFFPIGLVCLLGSRTKSVNAAIQRLERKLDEAGISIRPSTRGSICIQCKACNPP